MSDDQTTVRVDDVLLDHLETADLSKEAQELVLAAVLGEDDLSAVLDGAVSTRTRPPPPPPAADPVTAYLSRIEVRGFRGIGEAAALELVPGPGLTIVTGRNGSGKSSFAEAAELVLTGGNKRWADRTHVWREGWRNLHATGHRYIKLGLSLDGHRGGAKVECHWSDGAGLDEPAVFLQRAGERRQQLADLGWEQPLQLYRPFLSYSELGDLLSGRPSEMYDSLHRVLGLDRLAEVEQLLKSTRKEADQTRKAARAGLPQLREAVAAHPDPRARQAEQLLAAATVDIDRLEQLAGGAGAVPGDSAEALRAVAALDLPPREQVAQQVEQVRVATRELAALSATPAADARTVAGLLRDALQYHAHHPDVPCPVCGGRPLDRQWAQQARAQLDRLAGQAQQLEQADRTLRGAWRQLWELVPPTPAVLRAAATGLKSSTVDVSKVRAGWLRWDELARSEDPDPAEVMARFDLLKAATAPVRAAAEAALQEQQQSWQPVAAQLRTWVEAERRGRLAQRLYAASHQAVQWLVEVGRQIRNNQLAPLASEATAIWRLLRQDSNVDLSGVRLAGTGNQRKVELEVAVDGEPGAALGVMSQGELHALALSLFLPRAMKEDSPFRFLLIDDPVQSMDPAKVHGLARVLERAAAHRQVIVFTHDDRLPAAIRQLGVKARLLAVSRLEQSQVRVQPDDDGDPARRYLADAWAVAKDNNVDPALQMKVACVLVRDAIEAKCHDLVRVQGMRAGRPLAELEAALDRATGLREVVALALLGDADRAGELTGPLRNLHPRANQVVDKANRGAHGGQIEPPLLGLVDDARHLVNRLGAR